MHCYELCVDVNYLMQKQNYLFCFAFLVVMEGPLQFKKKKNRIDKKGTTWFHHGYVMILLNIFLFYFLL
jgi:hypothetical protein